MQLFGKRIHSNSKVISLCLCIGIFLYGGCVTDPVKDEASSSTEAEAQVDLFRELVNNPGPNYRGEIFFTIDNAPVKNSFFNGTQSLAFTGRCLQEMGQFYMIQDGPNGVKKTQITCTNLLPSNQKVWGTSATLHREGKNVVRFIGEITHKGIKYEYHLKRAYHLITKKPFVRVFGSDPSFKSRIDSATSTNIIEKYFTTSEASGDLNLNLICDHKDNRVHARLWGGTVSVEGPCSTTTPSVFTLQLGSGAGKLPRESDGTGKYLITVRDQALNSTVYELSVLEDLNKAITPQFNHFNHQGASDNNLATGVTSYYFLPNYSLKGICPDRIDVTHNGTKITGIYCAQEFVFNSVTKKYTSESFFNTTLNLTPNVDNTISVNGNSFTVHYKSLEDFFGNNFVNATLTAPNLGSGGTITLVDKKTDTNKYKYIIKTNQTDVDLVIPHAVYGTITASDYVFTGTLGSDTNLTIASDASNWIISNIPLVNNGKTKVNVFLDTVQVGGSARSVYHRPSIDLEIIQDTELPTLQFQSSITGNKVIFREDGEVLRALCSKDIDSFVISPTSARMYIVENKCAERGFVRLGFKNATRAQKLTVEEAVSIDLTDHVGNVRSYNFDVTYPFFYEFSITAPLRDQIIYQQDSVPPESFQAQGANVKKIVIYKNDSTTPYGTLVNGVCTGTCEKTDFNALLTLDQGILNKFSIYLVLRGETAEIFYKNISIYMQQVRFKPELGTETTYMGATLKNRVKNVISLKNINDHFITHPLKAGSGHPRLTVGETACHTPATDLDTISGNIPLSSQVVLDRNSESNYLTLTPYLSEPSMPRGSSEGSPTSFYLYFCIYDVASSSSETDQLKVNFSVDVDPLDYHQWIFKNLDQTAFFSTPATKVANGVYDINLGDLHSQYTGKNKGQNIGIYVSDDGMDDDHPDLINNLTSAPTLYPASSSNPSPHFHGTAVASLIAAEGWNNEGIRGVAPAAKITYSNLLSSEGGSLQQDRNEFGYIHSDQHQGYYVHNFSWGHLPHDGPDNPDQPIRNDYIFDDSGLANESFYERMSSLFEGGEGSSGLEGAPLLVKASGNSGYITEGSYTISYDANNAKFGNLPWLINVSGTLPTGAAALRAQRGTNIWISAPGFGDQALLTADVAGCASGNGYADSDSHKDFDRGVNPYNSNCNYTLIEGTSFAAPLVSGGALLVLESLLDRDDNTGFIFNVRNNKTLWRQLRHILAVGSSYCEGCSTGGAADWSAIADVQEASNSGSSYNLRYNRDVGFGVLNLKESVNRSKEIKARMNLDASESLLNRKMKLEQCLFSPGHYLNLPFERVDLGENLNTNPVSAHRKSITNDYSGARFDQLVVPSEESDFLIENVRLMFTIHHSDLLNLSIKVTSPSGTEALVLKEHSTTVPAWMEGSGSNLVPFAFLINNFYGEEITGTNGWKVEFKNRTGTSGGEVSSPLLHFYGHYSNASCRKN